MGTDIHGTFQKRNPEYTDDLEDSDPYSPPWLDLAHNYEFNRNYRLFSVLADVRNGYGFGGCITGHPVEPIDYPRGLPDDFPVCEKRYRLTNPIELFKVGDDAVIVSGGIWLGDHSFSWLTGAELLKWYDRAVEMGFMFSVRGEIEKSVYWHWKKTGASRPTQWAGEVGGTRLQVVKGTDGVRFIKVDPSRHHVIAGETLVTKYPDAPYDYVSAWWYVPVEDFVGEFFEEVRRLVKLHGEIRFVFGFDS